MAKRYEMEEKNVPGDSDDFFLIHIYSFLFVRFTNLDGEIAATFEFL